MVTQEFATKTTSHHAKLDGKHHIDIRRTSPPQRADSGWCSSYRIFPRSLKTQIDPTERHHPSHCRLEETVEHSWLARRSLLQVHPCLWGQVCSTYRIQLLPQQLSEQPVVKSRKQQEGYECLLLFEGIRSSTDSTSSIQEVPSVQLKTRLESVTLSVTEVSRMAHGVSTALISEETAAAKPRRLFLKCMPPLAISLKKMNNMDQGASSSSNLNQQPGVGGAEPAHLPCLTNRRTSVLVCRDQQADQQSYSHPCSTDKDNLTTNTKVVVYRAWILSTVLNGSETWVLSARQGTRLAPSVQSEAHSWNMLEWLSQTLLSRTICSNNTYFAGTSVAWSTGRTWGTFCTACLPQSKGHTEVPTSLLRRLQGHGR